jgi:hypothetical protein
VVAARIRELFEDWSVGDGDLVISGGARGGPLPGRRRIQTNQ